MSSASHHGSYGPPNYGPSSSGPSSHGFPPAFHEEYYYFPSNHHHEEKHIYHNKKGSELSIKDFFEIALTALAFLSFKLFIIQLLMNCAVIYSLNFHEGLITQILCVHMISRFQHFLKSSNLEIYI